MQLCLAGSREDRRDVFPSSLPLLTGKRGQKNMAFRSVGRKAMVKSREERSFYWVGRVSSTRPAVGRLLDD